MFQFFIDCKPTPWSAPQKGKKGFYDKKSQEKEFAKWQLRGQYRDPPLKGSISLEFIFFSPIPKGTSKARMKDMRERRILPTSPDTTNMQKLYEDCLQGVVIENDRNCNKITSSHYYADRPGVSILVRTWEEEMNKQHEIKRALTAEHPWEKV